MRTEAEIRSLPPVVREKALKAQKARDKAQKARDKAQKAWDKAQKALAQTIQENKSKMEIWHSQVCGCKEWNGIEIVFPEAEGVKQ